MTSKSNLLSNVCLILNVDGYYIHEKFQARELAFQVSHQNFAPESVHFKVANPSRIKDVRITEYVFRFVHGLPLKGGEMPQNRVRPYLSRLYHLNKSEERPYVAIKGNNQLEEILKELKIPFLDLEKLGCPSYEPLFPKASITCNQHSLGRRCSKSLVAAYRDWLHEQV